MLDVEAQILDCSTSVFAFLFLASSFSFSPILLRQEIPESFMEQILYTFLLTALAS